MSISTTGETRDREKKLQEALKNFKVSNYLKGYERFEDESYDERKQRLRGEKKLLKVYLAGRRIG